MPDDHLEPSGMLRLPTQVPAVYLLATQSEIFAAANPGVHLPDAANTIQQAHASALLHFYRLVLDCVDLLKQLLRVLVGRLRIHRNPLSHHRRLCAGIRE